MKVFIQEFEDMINKVRPLEKVSYGTLRCYELSKLDEFEMLTFGSVCPDEATRIAETCRAYGIKEFAISCCRETFFKTLAAFQEAGIFPSRTAVFEYNNPLLYEADNKKSQITVLIMKVN